MTTHRALLPGYNRQTTTRLLSLTSSRNLASFSTLSKNFDTPASGLEGPISRVGKKVSIVGFHEALSPIVLRAFSLKILSHSVFQNEPDQQVLLAVDAVGAKVSYLAISKTHVDAPASLNLYAVFCWISLTSTPTLPL